MSATLSATLKIIGHSSATKQIQFVIKLLFQNRNGSLSDFFPHKSPSCTLEKSAKLEITVNELGDRSLCLSEAGVIV